MDDEIRVAGLLGRLRMVQLQEWAVAQGLEVQVAVLGRFESIGALRVRPVNANAVDWARELLDLTYHYQPISGAFTAPSVVLNTASQRLQFTDTPVEIQSLEGSWRRSHQSACHGDLALSESAPRLCSPAR